MRRIPAIAASDTGQGGRVVQRGERRRGADRVQYGALFDDLRAGEVFSRRALTRVTTGAQWPRQHIDRSAQQGSQAGWPVRRLPGRWLCFWSSNAQFKVA